MCPKWLAVEHMSDACLLSFVESKWPRPTPGHIHEGRTNIQHHQDSSSDDGRPIYNGLEVLKTLLKTHQPPPTYDDLDSVVLLGP